MFAAVDIFKHIAAFKHGLHVASLRWRDQFHDNEESSFCQSQPVCCIFFTSFWAIPLCYSVRVKKIKHISQTERCFMNSIQHCCGPDSSVGITTDCGLDGPGIESRWERDFPHLSRPAHPASCTMGTGSFPVVKSGRGVTLTPHPLLVPWLWKSRAIPLLPLWAVRPVQSVSARTRVDFACFLYSTLLHVSIPKESSNNSYKMFKLPQFSVSLHYTWWFNP